jgi:pyridoxal phosphate enzyme (YggS family)
VAIAENLADVRRRMAEAARRAGRSPDEVTLIAISKTFNADAVREAWAAGQRDFGENKVQEALQKITATADMKIRWHLVGHLQSNKAKRAAASFACIHSVDSVELVERLDAATSGATSSTAPNEREKPASETALEILVQVDLASESTKFGAPEAEAVRCVRAALAAPSLRLAGLMLMPPWNDDQEKTRPWFRRLREMRDRMVRDGIPATALRHLSMGMSHDFEAAIEEGSTLVRVGTAIFGKRQARA